MRAMMGLAILCVVAFAVYLFQSTSARHERRQIQAGSSESTAYEASPRRLATERVQGHEPVMKPGSPTLEVRPKADGVEEPTGPFDIDMGEHTLHFKLDRGFAIRTKLSLRVPDMKTRKEVFRKRKALKRMLYFLGSKRRAQGARG
jgi:hypothetical protein